MSTAPAIISRVRTLGPYTLRRFIGAGAMGEVYEAVHTGLDKPVALKLFRATAKNHEHLERFLREGRAAARVRHPNAVDVTDTGREGDTYYLVMEYLEGEALNALLERSGRLSVARAIDIALPIAAALVRAHGQGIVHRDIKPHNIFLADIGRGEPEPKLLDFGISRFTLAGESPELTQNPQFLGTPLYLAPEQAEGRAADAASDQYALALTIYECILGVRPHSEHRDSFVSLLRAVAEAQIRPPRQLDPGLPAELDHALCRALSRDPSARFPNVRCLAAEILPFASTARRDLWRHAFVERVDDTLTSASAPITPLPPRPDERPSLGPILGHEALFGSRDDTAAPSSGSESQPEAPSDAPVPRWMSISGTGRRREARGLAVNTFGQSTLQPISTRPLEQTSSDDTQRLRRSIWATGAGFVGLMALTFGTMVVHDSQHAASKSSKPGGAPAAADPGPVHTFEVSIPAIPGNARFELDGREVAQGECAELPLDGSIHRLRVSAPDYEPQTIVFRDIAPEVGTIELTPAAQRDGQRSMTLVTSAASDAATPPPSDDAKAPPSSQHVDPAEAGPAAKSEPVAKSKPAAEPGPAAKSGLAAEPDPPLTTPARKTAKDSSQSLPFGTGNLDPWGP